MFVYVMIFLLFVCNKSTNKLIGFSSEMDYTSLSEANQISKEKDQ